MGYQATFEIAGYGNKGTAVTEYVSAESALEALAALKEVYGDKLGQVISLTEDAECECATSNCQCNC